MSINLVLKSLGKLVPIVGLVVAITTMMTSNQLSIYASSTSEDDGYTYPDDASEEEKEEIDEREQEAWEDAGRPGERDDDDDDEGNDNDDNNNDNTPVIANSPASTVQNIAVNETRWYNNCEGVGKQAGGWLHFDTFAYENCESYANGDKAYYDGFIEGCMGIDSANTKELCETFVVGCLRAISIDNSESCNVAVDTSSSAWKLVMTMPMDYDM